MHEMPKVKILLKINEIIIHFLHSPADKWEK